MVWSKANKSPFLFVFSNCQKNPITICSWTMMASWTQLIKYDKTLMRSLTRNKSWKRDLQIAEVKEISSKFKTFIKKRSKQHNRRILLIKWTIIRNHVRSANKLRSQKLSVNSPPLNTHNNSLSWWSRCLVPWLSFGTFPETGLEPARHIAKIPHPSSSCSLSTDCLHTPVVGSLASKHRWSDGSSGCGSCDGHISHTESVTLVPPLSETLCSLRHWSGCALTKL